MERPRDSFIRKLSRKLPKEFVRQQVGDITMNQVNGLAPNELNSARRSTETLVGIMDVVRDLRLSESDSGIKFYDDLRKVGSLHILDIACGLLSERVISNLPPAPKEVVERLNPYATSHIEDVKNVLSIRVDNVSIQDLLKERFDNTQAQMNNPSGSYLTLLIDLTLAKTNPALLDHIVEQNRDKNLSPDAIKDFALVSGTLAYALLRLHDLDRSTLVGKNSKAVTGIENETRRLFNKTSHLQNEIVAALSNPQSPQFSSVKNSLQPYLQSQDFNTRIFCIESATRGNIEHFALLYRIAQDFINKGVETEFYQSIVDATEETMQNENQNRSKIIILTKQHISAIFDSKQVISSQEKPTLEEVAILSRNLSFPKSNEAIHIDPHVVNQSGLATPTDVTIESRQDNNIIISFYYLSMDGKPMRFMMQFPTVRKNSDPSEFRWNVLSDPSHEPQLHEAAMRAAKYTINSLNLQQIEERKSKQQSRNATEIQPSPKKSYQPPQSRRQAPPQKVQEEDTSIPRDQVVITREVKKTIDRLPHADKNKIDEAIHAFNTNGENLRKLQLLGVRGGPYYGLNVEGGKIIVMQRVGKSSNLEVVALGTLQEAIKSLAK